MVLGAEFARGDMNADGVYEISDVVRLIDYVFRSGVAPVPRQRAEVNCDDPVDIFDVVELITHEFRGAPKPQCP